MSVVCVFFSPPCFHPFFLNILNAFSYTLSLQRQNILLFNSICCTKYQNCKNPSSSLLAALIKETKMIMMQKNHIDIIHHSDTVRDSFNPFTVYIFIGLVNISWSSKNTLLSKLSSLLDHNNLNAGSH